MLYQVRKHSLLLFFLGVCVYFSLKEKGMNRKHCSYVFVGWGTDKPCSDLAGYESPESHIHTKQRRSQPDVCLAVVLSISSLITVFAA